jgi:glycosyltransferase involved in cell wall biosynthesis
LSLFYFDFKRRGLSFPTPHAEHQAVHWCPGRLAEQAWKRLQWPPFNWFSGKADLYHFPNFTIPPLSCGRKVVTIHDMGFVRFPEFTEERNLRHLTAGIHRTAAQADAIITVSKFSAQEVATLLHVNPTRIHPIHLGVSSDYCRPAPDRIEALRRQYGLHRPYLLAVGTLEPRKNIPFLVEVFENLKDFDGEFVIAGMRGWKYEPILERIRTSPHSARIRFLEYVAEADLPALYAGAEVFVLASHYEGFGLPPLEAMACGTPVVSSAGGSLTEVLGTAARILPGFDRAEWVQVISRLLSDATQRQALSLAGLRHAAAFSWTETARKTFDVYRKVAG